MIGSPRPTRSKHYNDLINNSSPHTSLKYVDGSHNSCKKSALQCSFVVNPNDSENFPCLWNSPKIIKMMLKG